MRNKSIVGTPSRIRVPARALPEATPRKLNLDPASGNLFITRGTHVMVVNPDTGKLIADIGGLQGVHDMAFTGGRAYITEGGSNKMAVLDTKSFAQLSEISVGRGPDGILYDPA